MFEVIHDIFIIIGIICVIFSVFTACVNGSSKTLWFLLIGGILIISGIVIGIAL